MPGQARPTTVCASGPEARVRARRIKEEGVGEAVEQVWASWEKGKMGGRPLTHSVGRQVRGRGAWRFAPGPGRVCARTAHPKEDPTPPTRPPPSLPRLLPKVCQRGHAPHLEVDDGRTHHLQLVQPRVRVQGGQGPGLVLAAGV